MSKWVTFRDTITDFIAKWCLWNECRNSILMTYQYPDLVVILIGWSQLSANQTYHPDLGSERSPVWNFRPHFPDDILRENHLWPGEMSAVIRKGGNDYMNIFWTVCITSILPLHSGTLPYGYLSNTVTSLLWPHFWGGSTFPYTKNPINVVTH